jgi:hypothetical protein
MNRGEEVYVGIRPDVNLPRVSHRLLLRYDDGVGGICTSGLGGRSLTRGVASAATVFADRAAIADAAATSIANATFIKTAEVSRQFADKIDPDTDLKGIEVTTSVGSLSEDEIDKALEQGIARIEELARLGLIKGACVAVKSRMGCTKNISALLEPLPE